MEKGGKEKSSFYNLMGRLKEFWPISIIFMALTFLALLDQLLTLSTVLSLLLKEWRNIIHLIWEFPVNLILKIIGVGSFDLLSPAPEFLTFISMLIFTTTKKEKIEQSRIGSWLLKKNWELRDYFDRKLDFDNIKVTSFITFLVGNYVGVIILFLPYILVGYVLLEPSISWPLARVFIAIPILLMLSLGNIWKSKYEHISQIIELHGYVVMPIVIACAGIFAIFVIAFEIIIPSLWAFVQTA